MSLTAEQIATFDEKGFVRARYYQDKWKTDPPNDIEHSRSADSFLV
jgi:hypothetical protein